MRIVSFKLDNVLPSREARRRTRWRHPESESEEAKRLLPSLHRETHLMNKRHLLSLVLSLTALAPPNPASAQGASSSPPESSRSAPVTQAGADAPSPAANPRIDELDQKVRIIERRW